MQKAIERLQYLQQKIFLGWWVVGGAIGIRVLVTGLLLQAYGTYAVAWQEEFGWGKTALAFAFSLQQAQSGLISPLQGWLLQLFPPKIIIRLGLVLLGIGFLLLSSVSSLAGMYVVFLVMATGAAFSDLLSLTTAVVNWFERKRSTALALMQLGVSIGGFLVPAVAWSILQSGWRVTAVASGLLVLLIGLPLSAVIHRKPEEHGLLPDGALSTMSESTDSELSMAVSSNQERDFTLREATHTTSFWLLSCGHGLALMVVSAIMVHLVVYLSGDAGYSLAAASLFVALMTALTIVGQIVGGVLGDRISKRKLATLAMLGHSFALAALAAAQWLPYALFFAILHGFSWGMRGPLMLALRAEYFGRSSFASIMGIANIFSMVGMMSGPLLMGYLADYFNSYIPSFAVLALLSLTGCFMFWFATKPSLR